MPFTPFHFGAHACVALPLRKKIDVTVFILANVVIDIEPLMVMVFNLNYPLHGYAHTFIGAGIVGLIFGVFSWFFRSVFQKIAKIFHLPEISSLKQFLISGITGAW